MYIISNTNLEYISGSSVCGGSSDELLPPPLLFRTKRFP